MLYMTEKSESVISSACWRHYIGTWEIKDDRFYLKKLSGMYKINGREALFADWFSGTLRVPQGDILEYVHMGYGSVFEQETHIKIKDGLVKYGLDN